MRRHLYFLLLLGPAAAHAQSPAPTPAPALRTPSLWSFDYDADGHVDLLVQRNGRPRLLRNLGERSFVDVSESSGLPAAFSTNQVIWMDHDRDGQLDLLLFSYGDGLLWLHQHEGRFLDETARIGLNNVSGPLDGEGFDFDGDGDADLRIETLHQDRLFENAGGRFIEIELGLEDIDYGELPTPTDFESAQAMRGKLALTNPPTTAAGLAGPTGNVLPPPTHKQRWQGGTSSVQASLTCSSGVDDQANPGSCIPASSIPLMGRLFPLSPSFFIDTNGNVGVGTATPTHRLDVVGGDVVTDGQLVSTAVSGPPLQVNSSELVSGLNAQFLNGQDAAAFSQLGTTIETAELADGSVTTAKLLDESVTGDKLADDSVDSNHLEDSSVTSNKLGANSVQANHLADDAVGLNQLQDNSVGADELSDDSVRSWHIIANAVDSAAIQNGAITAGKINANSVVAPHIADDQIENRHLVDDSVGADELIDDSVRSWHIIANAVDNDAIQNGAITTGKIYANSVVAPHIADDQIESRHLVDDAIQFNHLATNSVGEDALGINCVGSAELKAFAVKAQHFDFGAIDAAAIGTGSVLNAALGNSSVTTDKLSFGAVTESKIATEAVSAPKIEAGAVTASKIASNAVQSSHIDDQSIQNADIASSAAISGSKISPDFSSQSVSANELGVGTSSPNTKIHVNAPTGTDLLRLQTNGSTKLFVDETGRMALGGFFDPDYDLDVKGDAYISGLGDSGATLTVNALSAGANLNAGIECSSAAAAGYGINAIATNSGSVYQNTGVRGEANSEDGVGLRGVANGSDGFGVSAIASGTFGTGVYGTGGLYGILGHSSGSGGAAIYASGTLFASGTKSFVQPHPTDSTKELRYVCLEGPEAGTYFRGTAQLVDGSATIEVPEHFRMVTVEEGMTVITTPIGGPAMLWIESQGLERIVVRGTADVEFSYLVNGVRFGFDDFEVVNENTSFVPKELGVPYAPELPNAVRELMVNNGTLNPDFTPNEATAVQHGWKLRARDRNDSIPAAPSQVREPSAADPE